MLSVTGKSFTGSGQPLLLVPVRVVVFWRVVGVGVGQLLKIAHG